MLGIVKGGLNTSQPVLQRSCLECRALAQCNRAEMLRPILEQIQQRLSATTSRQNFRYKPPRALQDWVGHKYDK